MNIFEYRTDFDTNIDFCILYGTFATAEVTVTVSSAMWEKICRATKKKSMTKAAMTVLFHTPGILSRL